MELSVNILYDNECRNLLQLQQLKGEFCDVIILPDEGYTEFNITPEKKEIWSHLCILTSSSPVIYTEVLNANLASQVGRATLRIKGVGSEVWNMILTYIYHGKVSLDKNELPENVTTFFSVLHVLKIVSKGDFDNICTKWKTIRNNGDEIVLKDLHLDVRWDETLRFQPNKVDSTVCHADTTINCRGSLCDVRNTDIEQFTDVCIQVDNEILNIKPENMTDKEVQTSFEEIITDIIIKEEKVSRKRKYCSKNSKILSVISSTKTDIKSKKSYQSKKIKKETKITCSFCNKVMSSRKNLRKNNPVCKSCKIINQKKNILLVKEAEEYSKVFRAKKIKLKPPSDMKPPYKCNGCGRSLKRYSTWLSHDQNCNLQPCEVMLQLEEAQKRFEADSNNAKDAEQNPTLQVEYPSQSEVNPPIIIEYLLDSSKEEDALNTINILECNVDIKSEVIDAEDNYATNQNSTKNPDTQKFEGDQPLEADISVELGNFKLPTSISDPDLFSYKMLSLEADEYKGTKEKCGEEDTQDDMQDSEEDSLGNISDTLTYIYGDDSDLSWSEADDDPLTKSLGEIKENDEAINDESGNKIKSEEETCLLNKETGGKKSKKMKKKGDGRKGALKLKLENDEVLPSTKKSTRSVYIKEESYNICNLCGFILKDGSKENLFNHKKLDCKVGSQKDYIPGPRRVCPICFKQLSSTYKLNFHLKVVHLGESPYECSLCPQAFKYRNAHRDHMMGVHKQDLINCSCCNLTFNTVEKYHRHRTLGLIAKGDKMHAVFMCEICGETFYDRCNYRTHRLFHLSSDEWKHKCEICDKMFPQKVDRDRHYMIHTGEKPFLCDICSYSTNRKYNLKLHQRKHEAENSESQSDQLGEKDTPSKLSYFCKYCQQEFKLKTKLKSHLKIHDSKAQITPCRTKRNKNKESEAKSKTEVAEQPRPALLGPQLAKAIDEAKKKEEIEKANDQPNNTYKEVITSPLPPPLPSPVANIKETSQCKEVENSAFSNVVLKTENVASSSSSTFIHTNTAARMGITGNQYKRQDTSTVNRIQRKEHQPSQQQQQQQQHPQSPLALQHQQQRPSMELSSPRLNITSVPNLESMLCQPNTGVYAENYPLMPRGGLQLERLLSGVERVATGGLFMPPNTAAESMYHNTELLQPSLPYRGPGIMPVHSRETWNFGSKESTVSSIEEAFRIIGMPSMVPVSAGISSIIPVSAVDLSSAASSVYINNPQSITLPPSNSLNTQYTMLTDAYNNDTSHYTTN